MVALLSILFGLICQLFGFSATSRFLPSSFLASQWLFFWDYVFFHVHHTNKNHEYLQKNGSFSILLRYFYYFHWEEKLHKIKGFVPGIWSSNNTYFQLNIFLFYWNIPRIRVKKAKETSQLKILFQVLINFYQYRFDNTTCFFYSTRYN